MAPFVTANNIMIGNGGTFRFRFRFRFVGSKQLAAKTPFKARRKGPMSASN
jgi:hypothetical protein